MSRSPHPFLCFRHPLVYLCVLYSVQVVLIVGTTEIMLDKWQLASSATLLPPNDNGKVISKATYDASKWRTVTVPSTVMAGLLEKDVYVDPFYGLNLLNISTVQFDIAWWYRIPFDSSSFQNSSTITFTLTGVNYAANVWINGVLLGSNNTVVGTFRRFDFDITKYLLVAGNAIALEISRPHDDAFPANSTDIDLAMSFIDWAPYPPDWNMGLWKPTWLSITGPVTIGSPMVQTFLKNNNTEAELFLLLEATNYSPSPVSGVLVLNLILLNYGTISVKQTVTLQGGQTMKVTFSKDAYPDLKLQVGDSMIWWPWQMGGQTLHTLTAAFYINSVMSDSLTTLFGIREAKSTLDKNGHRLYSFNGKDILIRGGGWAPDLFQRVDPVKQENEFRYVRHMGLNAIRLEGHLAQDSFYDLANQYGILLMPGISCCDAWQHWSSWTPAQYNISGESLRSQIKRLRIHPSIVVFLYSSDELPPHRVEQEYLDVLEDENWPNPVLATASELTSKISGPSGVKMSGPYSWVPPNYWLEDTHRVGGAFGFLTEGGPGEAPLTLESLQMTIPSEHMWPMDSYWDFHCGNPLGIFRNLRFFTPPLYARYGTATSAADYLQKSQVAAYEGIRAFFEGYSRNKYRTSTGLIQWMLNNAWPEMIWHLYDYYLNTPATFFAVKKACEDFHVQYSYNDNSIWVVNSLYVPQSSAYITAEIFNVDGSVVYTNKVAVGGVGPDSSTNVFSIPPVSELLKNLTSNAYFLMLYLYNATDNSLITDNTYWLSTKQDVLDWKNSTFYNTAVTAYADLTPLQGLNAANVTLTKNQQIVGNNTMMNIVVTNNSPTVIAFFVRLRITVGVNGPDVLPIFWSDNYITIPQLRTRNVSVLFDTSLLNGMQPTIVVEVFNNISGKGKK